MNTRLFGPVADITVLMKFYVYMLSSEYITKEYHRLKFTKRHIILKFYASVLVIIIVTRVKRIQA